MLRSIAIVGSGQVAFSAAIALKRALPHADVSVVACPIDPAALSDHAQSGWPRTAAFHARVGLSEKGFVQTAGGSHRLGTLFRNWQRGAVHIHAYGAPPTLTGYGLDSVSQNLARANRFDFPSHDSTSPLSDIDYAMRFNSEAYLRRLSAYADHLGARRASHDFALAIGNEAGGIDHIQLTNGARLDADLFVDCSGPDRRVMRATEASAFVDWSSFLPCDRLLLASDPDAPSLSVLDEIEAVSSGWIATTHGRDGAHRMMAYSASTSGDEQAMAALGKSVGSPITISQGRLKDSWTGNVVAFGDAAAVVEPLLWGNLTLAHEQILLFLELLPGRDIQDLERREFNRRAASMADRVRDFVAAHYHGPLLPTGPFWDGVGALDCPPSLALTKSEYERRGRIPFFEDEIVPREAWMSAFDCVGVPPGISSIAAGATAAEIAFHKAAQKRRNEAAVRMAPPYPQWLQTHLQARG